MTKNNSKKSLKSQGKKIFTENINMETHTVYHTDGRVDIYPCDFELGQQIVAGGKMMANQRGSLRTSDDGQSFFRPFREGTGSPFEELKKTPHGVVRRYKKTIVVRFSFSKQIDVEQIMRMFVSESTEIKNFMKIKQHEL